MLGVKFESSSLPSKHFLLTELSSGHSNLLSASSQVGLDEHNFRCSADFLISIWAAYRRSNLPGSGTLKTHLTDLLASWSISQRSLCSFAVLRERTDGWRQGRRAKTYQGLPVSVSLQRAENECVGQKWVLKVCLLQGKIMWRWTWFRWRLQPLQNSSLYPRGLTFVLTRGNNVVFELRPHTVQSAWITIHVVQMETVYGAQSRQSVLLSFGNLSASQ